MLKELIDYVENNSWFVWEEGNDMFATREHGDILNEEAGEKDWNEAIRIKKLLKEKFPQYKYIDIEECDEWVTITVE